MIYKKCYGEEMDNFIQSYIAKEGSPAISGHSDMILRRYPIDKLPQKIFELERVKKAKARNIEFDSSNIFEFYNKLKNRK